MSHLFLVRLSGELSIKGKTTRGVFTRRLAGNVKDALRSEGIEAKIERTWSRFYVRSKDSAAGDVLRRVFGISSVSRAERRPWATLEDIVNHGEELFGDRVAGRKFAVKARRADPTGTPFKSADLERELGSRLFERSAGVDLSHPEVIAFVEVHAKDAYFFHDRLEGEDGLPLGTEHRALALVSGGFDSIVAAWKLLRRGVTLDYLFCNLGGATHQAGALQTLKVLADRWSYGTRPRLHMVDFHEVVQELRAETPPQLWQIVLKRQMLRAAGRIAEQIGSDAVATGEAIGQVSSQTLPNLAVISEVSALPVLRPLISTNKKEIVALAQHIGSYELSAKVPEYCALDAKNPATKSTSEQLVRGEAGLDPALLERLVAERTILDLRSLDLDKAAAAADLEVDRVPEGALVLDLRSPPAFDAWHYPGAVRMSYFEALKTYREFARDKAYLIYCEIGLKSAHLAEVLRENGVEATCFRGGLKSLMRYAEGEDPALRALRGPAFLERSS